MNKYCNITIYPLSSSTQQGRFLLSCNGRYFEASNSMKELVETLQVNSTEEDGIAVYISSINGKFTSEQIQHIIDRYISPLFEEKEKERTFLYEKELFSENTIEYFSNKCRFLFHRVLVAVIIFFIFIADLYFFLTTDNLLIFNNQVTIYMVGVLFIFMLISSFLHELGHASACKFFDLKHGGIGFGLYITFPVLYTDVTDVWRVNRMKRCVVNIAGVYFQCYLLIVLLAVFLVTGNDMLRYLILIINLGFLMTLNPFFKFDGYWIASDLLGVPNLRTRSLELVEYWFKRIRKQPIDKIPYLLQIRPLEKYGLLVYSVIVNIFMAFYFCYIIPKFLYKFIKTFPNKVNELILCLSNNIIPPFALLRNIGTQLILLVLIGYFLYKLIFPFLRRYVIK